MAQKDYVSRAKKGGQRKKTSNKKAKSSKDSLGLLLLLAVVVSAFVGGLYFLKTKRSDPVTPKSTQPKNDGRVTNTIPPTPNKRWVYVDALVNPGHKNSVNTASKGKTTPNSRMSAEQQRILSMMDADRPQQNTNTPATYNQQVDRNSQNDRLISQPSKPSTAGSGSTQTGATSQIWSLQCGSFRNKEGAESVKAQLALSGVASKIIYSDSLHRIIVGPYKTKRAAADAQSQLQRSGINHCHLRG